MADETTGRRLMVHWQMEVHDGEGKRFVNAEFNVPILIFNEQRRTLMESLESMMLEEGRLRGFTLPENGEKETSDG